MYGPKWGGVPLRTTWPRVSSAKSQPEESEAREPTRRLDLPQCQANVFASRDKCSKCCAREGLRGAHKHVLFMERLRGVQQHVLFETGIAARRIGTIQYNPESKEFLRCYTAMLHRVSNAHLCFMPVSARGGDDNLSPGILPVVEVRMVSALKPSQTTGSDAGAPGTAFARQSVTMNSGDIIGLNCVLYSPVRTIDVRVIHGRGPFDRGGAPSGAPCPFEDLMFPHGTFGDSQCPAREDSFQPAGDTRPEVPQGQISKRGPSKEDEDLRCEEKLDTPPRPADGYYIQPVGWQDTSQELHRWLVVFASLFNDTCAGRKEDFAPCQDTDDTCAQYVEGAGTDNPHLDRSLNPAELLKTIGACRAIDLGGPDGLGGVQQHVLFEAAVAARHIGYRRLHHDSEGFLRCY